MLISIASSRFCCLLRQQLLVRGEAGLGLRLTRARRGAHPLELARQRPLPRRLRLLLAFQALLLLVEPRRIVPLPGDAGAAIELQDPARDVVEEVAIVRDRDDRPRVLVQVVLQPGDALRVEVVGRLVEQQHVGTLEQHAAERHAPPLAARQLGRRRRRRAGSRSASIAISSVRSRSQPLAASIASCSLPCSSSSLSISPGFRSSPSFRFTSSNRVEQALRVRHRQLDVSQHVLGRIQRGLLGQVADADAVGRLGVAEEVLVHARHDAQERRLPGAVRAEHADLGARVERQIDPLQHLLVGRVDPPEVLHRVDVLVRHGGGSLAQVPPTHTSRSLPLRAEATAVVLPETANVCGA